MKVYKQFQKASPEIFIPAPPLMGPLGGGEDSVDTYQRRAVGDRAKLNAKIEQELGRDILEKPDTGTRSEEGVVEVGVGGGGGAPVAAAGMVEGEDDSLVGRAPDETSSVAGKAGQRWFVDGADKDANARKQRDKVKEVSFLGFSYLFRLYFMLNVNNK